MYSFVPDGGFVGTTFVHALANTLLWIWSQCFTSNEFFGGCKVNNSIS